MAFVATSAPGALKRAPFQDERKYCWCEQTTAAELGCVMLNPHESSSRFPPAQAVGS